ncbi:hypothetical protein L228DRAFT_12960 [Xylona heveae TC161]|uniref:Zn(2)-C6 fungal-type domain-containing protein n=1 Tax=Xylona heveae (strain CBS 132557 / TC161) TaxID=1328760 RepID=A0A165JNT0_XYLHT|nr:hypothetical protein L228DRAFT_12960 [Xylona heveae TC161]KZF26461.1 hypothetical protein L228DRAFT_12960 [Xylona heveae TC161]
MPSGAVSVSSASASKLASCDECRLKKVKCSGEPSGCSRCVREGIPCHYSDRQKMGRPRKRRLTSREDGEEKQDNTSINTTFSKNGHNDKGIHMSNMPNENNLVQNSSPFTPPFSDETLNLLSPTSNFNMGFPSLENFNFSSNNDIHIPSSSSEDVHLSLDPYLNTQKDFSSFQTPSFMQNLPGMDGENSCACLSNLYLAMSELQTVPPDFPFPSTIHLVSKAVPVARGAIDCPICGTKFLLGMPNTMLVISLLSLMASICAKTYEFIDTKADDSKSRGETKLFRMGEMDPQTIHLHTGTADCPMGFNVELEPDEWRHMAKRVVRATVKGKGDGKSGLMGLIAAMEERQKSWHENHVSPIPLVVPNPEQRATSCQGASSAAGTTPVCVRMVHNVRGYLKIFD